MTVEELDLARAKEFTTYMGLGNAELPTTIRAMQRLRLGDEARGLRVVPVEATEDMHNSARDWSKDKYGKPIGRDASAGCWSAMLAASPFAAEPEEKG